MMRSGPGAGLDSLIASGLILERAGCDQIRLTVSHLNIRMRHGQPALVVAGPGIQLS
jgi:hypothetical protein